MEIVIYPLTPLLGWLTSGVLKFMINYSRFGSAARHRIGNGGFPSTHTTVVTSTLMLIGFSHGFGTPVFSLGAAFLLITVVDATGIRRTLGNHARILNATAGPEKPLRESQGHSWGEVVGGVGLGTLLGYIGSLLI